MTDSNHPRLVLIPGLGADARLLEPQRAAFPGLEVPAWIDPIVNETLPAYAQRMAEKYFQEVPITPFFLGGVSFGGMLSLEMARIMKPKAVFLIASSTRGYSMRKRHSLFRFLLRHMPRSGLTLIKHRIAPLTLYRLGKMNAAQKRVCLDMLQDIDLNFFAWAARALLNWDFSGPLPCPVYAVHGDADKIIPLRRVRADLIVPGAGHVVNLTHAAEVNKFLLEKMGV